MLCYIFGAAKKWQNLTDFDVLKICTVHYYGCHILLSLHNLEYKVFRFEDLHVVVHNIIYLKV
jgi:hypothetical protein